METRDEELIAGLIETDEELRTLVESHREFRAATRGIQPQALFDHGRIHGKKTNPETETGW